MFDILLKKIGEVLMKINWVFLCSIYMLVISSSLQAQEVWTESVITFEKGIGFPSLPSNQDRITDNVWITRDVERGIFNIAPGFETEYTSRSSPLGTEWAFAGLNGNPASISAADFASLNFTDWQTALGSRGNLENNILNRAGVVHLIDDDIYIDITFTLWGARGGGTFRYDRASEPLNVASPEPIPELVDEEVPLPWFMLLILGVILSYFGIKVRTPN